MGAGSSNQGGKEEVRTSYKAYAAEQLRQQLLEKELKAQAQAAVAPQHIDLRQEVPDLRGQAGATGLQDVAEDDQEEVSGDSDIIDDDDIPEPIEPVISVVEEEIDAILKREQEKVM